MSLKTWKNCACLIRKYQNHSDNAAMQLVARVFNVKEEAIHNIRCLKSGMTNQSFLFELDGKHYICRIPVREQNF